MNNRHKPYKVHINSLQAVQSTEEPVLIEWIEWSAESGTPMDHQSILAHASDIAGHSLGKCWMRQFRKCHPELVTSKPAKLDPKWAKNFNETIVKDYFEKWEALNTEYGGIPPEHIWNMDEKGIQMGGGRKNSGKMYFYLRVHRNRYWISSDNLELVMVIECVSAAGESVPTSFVLSDGPKPDLRKLSDGSYGG